MMEKVKKILWIVGTVAVGILYSYIVAIILTIGNMIVSIFTHSETGQINQQTLDIILSIGWIVLIGASILLYRRWKMKCHSCNRWGALKKVQTDLLKTEDISVLMELEDRNSNRQVIGTHDQYVPGKRNTYRNIYKCQYCGNLEAYKYTVDKADI